jgi:hypothetical protein
VVDVNKFGSFIGVPDAPAKLADYVLEVGEGMVKGNTPLTVKEFGPGYR